MSPMQTFCSFNNDPTYMIHKIKLLGHVKDNSKMVEMLMVVAVVVAVTYPSEVV